MDNKDLGNKLKEIDAKVDKALGVNVKPIHYAMIALILFGIISNFVNG